MAKSRKHSQPKSRRRNRPNDDQLASFCWRHDTSTVEKMLEFADAKLRKLRLDVENVAPFPQSKDELGTFGERDWWEWIDSVQPDDDDHVEALRRLVATCRARLEFETQATSAPPTSGDSVTNAGVSGQASNAAGPIPPPDVLNSTTPEVDEQLSTLRASLQRGESRDVAFVSSAGAPEFARSICALANADGGVVYVGVHVKEDGADTEHVQVTGTDPQHVHKFISELDTYFKEPLPRVRATEIHDPAWGRPVIAVTVEKSSTDVALADRTIWRRKGRKNYSVEARIKANRNETADNTPDLGLKQNVPVEGGGNTTDSDQDNDQDICDAVPIDRVSAFGLSESVRGAIKLASETGVRRAAKGPIDTSRLLFGLIDRGRRKPDHRNIAAFLAKRVFPEFEMAYQGVRSNYFREVHGKKKVDNSLTATHVSPAVWQIFQRAHDFAIEVGEPSGMVGGRFVLAALLLQEDGEPDGGALERLKEIGVNIQDLSRDFRQILFTAVPEGEREHWRVLYPSESETQRSQIAYFNADRVGDDEDQLEIMDDVNAMANLIASRSLMPPLSVGLFGNWGSGKTFFIEKLCATIEEISEHAKADDEYGHHYWANVVQVKFNAWNYVDANLWASLVSYLFEQLSRWDSKEPNKFEAARRKAISDLGIAKAAHRVAEMRKRDAEESLKQAEENKNAREKAISKDRDALADAIKQDIWDEVRTTVATNDKPLQNHLHRMGIAADNLEQSAEQVYEHLQEMQTLAGRTRALWITLFSSASLTNWFWLIGAAAVLLLIGTVVCANWYPIPAWLTATFGEAAILLGAIATWIKTAAGRLSEAMHPLRTLHAKVDSALKAEERKKEADIAKLKDQLQQKQAEYEIAVSEVDRAVAAIKTAKAELAEVHSGQRIKRFIEQRAASADYRTHLGIVATIRDDFEQLNQMIIGYNDDLQLRDDERPSCDGPEEMADAAETAQSLGINRIVLYIDDLDRCPPERVVEVLQAIHLLLAFPLFVVVVAVDSRWISYALQDQYPHLLVDSELPWRQEQDPNPGRTTTQQSSSASPRDYLEKIFQIPYWIRAMDAPGCERLIDGLTESDLRAATADTQSAEPVAEGSSSEELPDVADETVSEPRTDEQSVVENETPDTPQQAVPDVEQTVTDGQPGMPQPESLSLHTVEIAAMKQLAPIVGRSPRETKRFVNVYRLIKAATPADKLTRFVGTEDEPGSFRSTMLLLAIVTGTPQFGRNLSWQLDHSDPGESHGAIIEFVDRMQLGDSLAGQQLQLLKNFFAKYPDWASIQTAELRGQLARVSQFSFKPAIVSTNGNMN